MVSNRGIDPVATAAREADREGRRTVLTPTEARQASPRRMNLRVLVVSLAVLAAVGLALTAAYWGTAVEDHSIPSGPAQSSEASKAMDGTTTAAPTTPQPAAPGTNQQPGQQ